MVTAVLSSFLSSTQQFFSGDLGALLSLCGLFPPLFPSAPALPVSTPLKLCLGNLYILPLAACFPGSTAFVHPILKSFNSNVIPSICPSIIHSG